MTSVTSKDEGEKGETQNELQTNAVLLDKLQEQVCIIIIIIVYAIWPHPLIN